MHLTHEALCPVCGTATQGRVTECADCQVQYHPDCFRYVGRCSIYGCAPIRAPIRAPRPPEDEAPPRRSIQLPGMDLLSGLQVLSIACDLLGFLLEIIFFSV